MEGLGILGQEGGGVIMTEGEKQADGIGYTGDRWYEVGRGGRKGRSGWS